MTSIKSILLFIVFSPMFFFMAQPLPGAENDHYASWEENLLVLDNGVVKREIVLPGTGGQFATRMLVTDGDEINMLQDGSLEFYFELDGGFVSGLDRWFLNDIQLADDSLGGHGATVLLTGIDKNNGEISVAVTYLLYPALPVVRKQLIIVNNGDRDIKVESVDVEHLRLDWSDTHSWVMANYGRQKRLGPFTGGNHDALVIVHDIRDRRGLALGNEAPAVTKRTAAFLDGHSISVGLARPDAACPFRKWLNPGESWKSPRSFIAVYTNSTDPWNVLNGPVNDFVRRHMGIQLAAQKVKPVFVYNTWNPFRKNVNDKLVRELAEAAAACGVEEFIIDDGWQINRGDWEIDRQKFPDGLKPVFDHIRSLGMKPGLWLSLTGAEINSKVYADHPEWFVRDDDGNIINLHGAGSREKTACFATGWYGHIRDIILGLVREHGLAYVKLDITIAASSYLYDKSISGCCATDHPLHHDRPESFLVIYRRCMELFDELHREAPQLFIDCTFETWGKLQTVDYALVQHADGDWLANVEEPVPYGSLRVRNLAWWRSPGVPAGTLVIGNLTLDDPGRLIAFKSLAGTLPIMLGDPREVQEEERKQLRDIADWLREMQESYGYMLFRQDIVGWGEPVEGGWDGWARLNTDTFKGGIIGVFRQGSSEARRLVRISGIDQDALYSVRTALEGSELVRMRGIDLAETGIPVRLENEYDGVLLEIRRVE